MNMSGNISRRRGIHPVETPQLEKSDQCYGINAEIDPIDRSESDSEYEAEENSCGNIAHEEKRSGPPQQNKQKAPLNNKKPATMTVFISVVLILVTLAYFRYQQQKICSFEPLKTRYPDENHSMWKHLKYGMEMILNKRVDKPAVYLLAHHGKHISFKVIKDIAEHSSKCFGKNLVSMKINDFLIDTGSPDDYGYAIEKYKRKIEEGNVCLIANLNEISPRAARAFHAICDTHNPIRKNVVIFLSLTIEQNKTGNAHYVAEETLTELWTPELADNELGPLITRVTDQVFILKS